MKKFLLKKEEMMLLEEDLDSHLDKAFWLHQNGLNSTTLSQFRNLSKIAKRYLIKNNKRQIKRNISYMYFPNKAERKNISSMSDKVFLKSLSERPVIFQLLANDLTNLRQFFLHFAQTMKNSRRFRPNYEDVFFELTPQKKIIILYQLLSIKQLLQSHKQILNFNNELRNLKIESKLKQSIDYSTDRSEEDENSFLSQFLNHKFDFEIMSESDQIFHGTTIKPLKKPKEYKVSRVMNLGIRP